MGYTHYWKMTKALTITPIQKALIKEVLDTEKEHLCGWDGNGKVLFNAKSLSFNGNAELGLDHESFTVDFGKLKSFDFCKTAAKPYDLAVCKILLVLSLSDGFNFHSDGGCDGNLTDESWPDALLWFIKKGHEDTIKNKIVPSLNQD